MPVEEIVERTYTINGVSYQFIIDATSGAVLDSNNKVVCEVGGQACLEAFVSTLEFSVATVNGVSYNIYKNGAVYDVSGKLICTEGGQDCLI